MKILLLDFIRCLTNFKVKKICGVICFLTAAVVNNAFALNSNLSVRNGKIDRNISPVFLLKDHTNGGLKKERYVWFEANTERYLDKFMACSKQWASIAKPIVTARIFNVENFIERLNHEGIDVIGGFKTSNAVGKGDFCDLKTWRKIAEVARNVSEMTGGRPVVLENEGAVKIMISKGASSVNYDKLLKAVSSQNWPEIWFWFSPLGQEEPLKTMSYDIAKAIKNGIPNCRLIEPNSAGFTNSSYNYTCKVNLERTLSLDSDPVSIIYLDDYKKNYWPLKNTDKALDRAKGRTVIIYPGLDDLGNFEAVRKSIKNE